MKYTSDKIIGEIVAEDYRTAKVFKKHGIDFCCSGNRNLGQACAEKNLDTEAVAQELEDIQKATDTDNTDFQSWPLDLLADYIEKKHHRYVEQQIPVLQGYLNKINRVHGARHPELAEIEERFNAAAQEFSAHMKKEELMLFPQIRKIATGQEPSRSVSGPIKQMMAEHDTEGEQFRRIAELSNNYTAPMDACNTYRVAFGLLEEFEDDLHRHIHLENNVLFPKSIELEETRSAVNA